MDTIFIQQGCLHIGSYHCFIFLIQFYKESSMSDFHKIIKRVNHKSIVLLGFFPNKHSLASLSSDSLKPFPPKISLVILCTVWRTVLRMLVQRIWNWINKWSFNFFFFLFSHHLSAWYCIEILEVSSVPVTRGIWSVKRTFIFVGVHGVSVTFSISEGRHSHEWGH